MAGSLEHRPEDQEFLFLAWLDELLYRAEVLGQWYVDGQVHVLQQPDGLTAVAQVSFVDASLVEREIEIKAVTTHQLIVAEVQPGESCQVRGRMFRPLMARGGTPMWCSTFEVGEPRVDVRFARPNPQASSIPDPHSTHGPR